MVTKELSEAAVEFEEILNNCSEEVINKVSPKFINFLKKIKADNYKFTYDQSKKLKEQKINKTTKGLIALVYRDYLCNEEERAEFERSCKERLREKEEEKRRLYNNDNLFMNRGENSIQNIEKTNNTIPNNMTENNNTTQNDKCTEMIQYKENIWTKVLNKIKQFFSK